MIARPWWLVPAVLGLTLLALFLRIAAARGGLWLDEAWTVTSAHDVGTPLGILLSINHDNNHHLNSLWVQMVGLDAPPLVQRALSIVSGVAAVPVAAAIAGRRGAAAALIAALLFAVSPILVNYGSEARGYAPMLLALLCAILLLDRWLARETTRSPAVTLALVTLAGLFAQLTMAFGLLALAGWGIAERRGEGLRVVAPALVVTVLVGLSVVLLIPGPGGFRFGSFHAFTWAEYAEALKQAADYGLGSYAFVPLIALVMLVVAGARRLPLHLLAIIGLPAMVALLQLGNAGYPRYYLLSVVATLLLTADLTGSLVKRGGRRAVAAVALIAAMTAACLWRDAGLIANQRGDPAAAIRLMAAQAPAGTDIILDQPRSAALLQVTAAQARYPLRFAPCGRFLFVERDGAAPFSAAPIHCGARYHPIAGRVPQAMSGTQWRLYARAGPR